MPGVKLELDTLATLDLAPDHLLRFDRYGVRVDGGFARSLSGGWFLYGAATAGTVKTLALQPCAKALPDPAAVAALEDLAQRHGLLLVDWCRCAIGEPGTKSFVHVIAGPQ
jgi:hypothetical protein